ncbi:MAG: RNA-binding transcriptional accessory protein [Clostridia bacterium]|nr:RNA-binding transcriptional accessory protein [Clostridia bacterium]
MDKFVTQLASELHLKAEHIENVIKLIDEGNTIPFIARYRKELTGSMDDQVLRELSDRLEYLRNLDKRRCEVLSSIEEQGKLTDEISKAVANAKTLAEVEDIYRPYKQKRRTRATVAAEKGLTPLAEAILEGGISAPENFAAEFIDEEKGVHTAEEALAGASDIIAEKISDDADIRREIREQYAKNAAIVSAVAGEDESVYGVYREFSSSAPRLMPHQVLAIDRGEKEGFLKVSVHADAASAEKSILSKVINKSHSAPTAEFITNSARDSYSRLIAPSAERELRSNLTANAAEQSIRTFALNLRQLIMQPPLKGRVVMGFDPAYRTGCKIAVVDETGKVLETGVVYPTPPHSRTEEAAAKLSAMIRRHGVSVIAVGNGTASRESEIFVSGLIKEHPGTSYMMVSEAGASVYSASKLGAEEFPDYDVSLRSAVSIARRLQDPLAELVKIDPKSIGVGQYQHDMPQARLSETLAGTVESCVNSVGVDLNTASASLLSYVAGLGPATAKGIVAYRDKNGAFTNRKQLLKVPRLGPAAFVQCAGFLRISDGDEPLDNTAIHPESYDAAKKILDLCGYSPKDVDGGLTLLELRASKIGISKLADAANIGELTVSDILAELQKPRRDPRDELPPPMLRTDVMDLNDLKSGMVIRGTVRNVVDFGAFVDIGVHQDGLVHISEISNRRVRHPSEVVKVGDIVDVTVLGVDPAKKRISLSLRMGQKNS